MKLNLANKLTIGRILLVPVFVVFFSLPGPWYKLTAGLIFGLAAWTDVLDGRVARRRKEVTNFGMVIDPLADKLLVCAPLVLFVEGGLIPTWMVLVILGREFAISGLRVIAAGKGLIISASRTGRHKTASQVAAIGVILTLVFFRALLFSRYGTEGLALRALGWSQEWWSTLFVGLPYLMMLVAVFFSLFSGIDYFWKNRHIFQGEF